MTLPTLSIGDIHFKIEGNLGNFHPALSHEEIEKDLHLIHFEISAGQSSAPSPIKLAWQFPIADVQSTWHPAAGYKRVLTLPWDISVKSDATMHSPVVCLHNLSGTSQLTFACSDVLNHIESTASVHEQTANFNCHIHFFVHPVAPFKNYKATLRLDLRHLPYHESLRQTQLWWTTFPGTAPSSVPNDARLPMYSTWYSFHQDMTADAVEHQCRIAREIGCDAVIIDDGWQTEDNNGGYAYCGDWEVTPVKFPSMKEHISRLHDMGVKSLVWFSVPFIGYKSKNFKRFEGKYLTLDDRLSAAVLDPRFPEVREYLITLYENYLREWKIDGFKLDFVDRFSPTEKNYNDGVKGRDIESVPEAVDCLLRTIMERLRKINPDIMIEFRQSYVGPLMRHYGNLFRAADCPNDSVTNRIRTLDIRLLAGNTATHADMLMWSVKDPVESAALQFLNILFSVPQISVKLDEIPSDHLKMLRFWLSFWKSHRETLLDGILEPFYPDQLFPFVLAKVKDEWIGAFYSDVVGQIPGKLPAEFWLVNATQKSRLVVELDNDSGAYKLEAFNTLGDSIGHSTQSLTPGLKSFSVPPSGLLHFKKA